MEKVYVFLANGFEDIEALAPIDVFRRGGIDVKTVSITGCEMVESAHGVSIKADMLFEAANLSDAGLLLLPGGMPGAANLNAHEGLKKALLAQNARGKKIAAICAAPMVLGDLGLLQGKRATCYPGFEGYLEGAVYTQELVTTDGNITTGEGPAAALPFAYRLLTDMAGEETVQTLQDQMMYTHLMEGKE